MTNIVSIKLLDREYQVKSPAEKVSELQEAANYLDAKMRELIDGGKKPNVDLILMIAALNITHELTSLKKKEFSYIERMNKRILDLQSKIDEALAV